MHQALKIDELLVHIFTNLWEVDSSTTEEDEDLYHDVYPTLASLARTCRTFHERALDILWHTQRGLVPILLCFSDSISEHVDTDLSRSLVRSHLFLRIIQMSSPHCVGPEPKDNPHGSSSFLEIFQEDPGSWGSYTRYPDS